MQKDKSEQWLDGGDCHICRRNKYCDKENKPCKTAVKRQTMQVAATMTSVMMDILQKSIE